MATHSSIFAWRIPGGQGSLAGYSPWHGKELYTTERLSTAHRVVYKPDITSLVCSLGFSGGSAVKNSPAIQETRVQSLGWEDPLEEGMTTHSSIPAWSIPWTEKPGRLQSTGSQRVGPDM